jgi:hypothetical protein
MVTQNRPHVKLHEQYHVSTPHIPYNFHFKKVYQNPLARWTPCSSFEFAAVMFIFFRQNPT